MKKLAGFVEGEDDPVIGDPIGREALLAALQYEMIPYTPEDLIEIANKELNRELSTSFVVVTHDMAIAGKMQKTMHLEDGKLK